MRTPASAKAKDDLDKLARDIATAQRERQHGEVRVTALAD